MTMAQSATMKTMKTGDINATSDDSNNMLENMFGKEDDKEEKEISMQKTRVNFRQKLKFCLHWFLMIYIHIEIFWMIPIVGNLKLYNEKPYCDAENVKEFPYGCKNFHDNKPLIIFYFLFCIYFMLSAL